MSEIVIKRERPDLPEPGADESRGWLAMPPGRYFRESLFEELEDLKEAWMNGMFTGQTNDETCQMNSEAIGKAQQIASTLLKLEEMQDE